MNSVIPAVKSAIFLFMISYSSINPVFGKIWMECPTLQYSKICSDPRSSGFSYNDGCNPKTCGGIGFLRGCSPPATRAQHAQCHSRERTVKEKLANYIKQKEILFCTPASSS